MTKRAVRLGIVGLGHWGPNHVRVFQQCTDAKVVVCADSSAERCLYISKLYPAIRVVGDASELLRCDDVDAVVIATPTHTHYALAKAALRAGKHILLEKPMCSTIKEAEELIQLGKKMGSILMNGHVFLYNRGIQYVKEEAKKGSFGKIQYVHATRTNLGPIRYDINVIRDLATHEFSISDYLFGRLPKWLSASASFLLGTPREDVAFLTMEYQPGILTHAHVSWLHPQKIRTMTLVGDKRMVYWNDLDASEPIRIYNKGVMDEPYYDSFGEFQLRLRDGSVLIPKLSLEEPLRLQAEAFIQSVKKGKVSLSGPEAGLRVMRCLDAAQRSLRSNGRRINLK
jgi:predicted dehydrogenase